MSATGGNIGVSDIRYPNGERPCPPDETPVPEAGRWDNRWDTPVSLRIAEHYARRWLVVS